MAIGTPVVNIMVFICHVTLQDHVIKALNDFMVRIPSRYATIMPKFGVGHSHCDSRDKFQFVTSSRKITISKRYLSGFQPVRVSYHSNNFDGHRQSGGRDIIMVFVTLQDHVIKGSSDFMQEPIKASSILQSLVAINTLVVKL